MHNSPAFGLLPNHRIRQPDSRADDALHANRTQGVLLQLESGRQPAFSVHYSVLLHVQMGDSMRQVAFTELRNHAKAFFDLVETGEVVRVLRNGKPIADIVPVAADLPSWKRRCAQPLVLDGVSISKMILDDREA